MGLSRRHCSYPKNYRRRCSTGRHSKQFGRKIKWRVRHGTMSSGQEVIQRIGAFPSPVDFYFGYSISSCEQAGEKCLNIHSSVILRRIDPNSTMMVEEKGSMMARLTIAILYAFEPFTQMEMILLYCSYSML